MPVSQTGPRAQMWPLRQELYWTIAQTHNLPENCQYMQSGRPCQSTERWTSAGFAGIHAPPHQPVRPHRGKDSVVNVRIELILQLSDMQQRVIAASRSLPAGSWKG